VHRAEVVLRVAASAEVVRVAAMPAVLVVIAAKAAEVADKSHARCTKNACSFKGNPLKRLK
jgi:hypothetical protein